MGRILGGIMRGLSDKAGVARSAKRAKPLQVPQPRGRNASARKRISFRNFYISALRRHHKQCEGNNGTYWRWIFRSRHNSNGVATAGRRAPHD